jgi:CHAD domain-containing protein
MEDLPARLFDRPSPEVARWFALVRLHELSIARERLAEPDNSESLHNFRVALRRLRSLLRAYREVLADSVPGKSRRRLGALATASGPSRDSEVRQQWLRQRVRAGPDDDPGLKWVERLLERDRRKGDHQLRRALDQDFPATVGRLRQRLHHYRVTYALGETTELPPAREFVSRTLHTMALTLEEILAAPRTMGDTDALHRARVVAKRLRYTLEPLVEGSFAPAHMVRAIQATLAKLKVLQDELGQLHDALTFDRWLGDRIAEEAARRTRDRDAPVNASGSADPTDERPADPAVSEFVNVLRRQLHEQSARHYGVLDSARRRRQTERLIRQVHLVADRLSRRRLRTRRNHSQAEP